MTTIKAVLNETSELVLHSVTAAGVGYLCARVFMSTINPIHAAVVTGLAALASRITKPLFDKIFGGFHSNQASRVLGSILNITSSVAIAASVATAIGFPVSMPAFLCLNAFTIGAFALVALGVTVVKVIETKHAERVHELKERAFEQKKHDIKVEIEDKLHLKHV